MSEPRRMSIPVAEHRAREHFQYRDRAVFSPHYDIEDLWWRQ